MMNKIKAFAVAQGFDSVSFAKTWNGFKVYEAYIKNDPPLATGYPNYILVAEDKMTFASPEQVFEIMGMKFEN